MTTQAQTEKAATLVEPVSWLMAARSAMRSAIVVAITLLDFQARAQSRRYRVSVDHLAQVAGVGRRTAQRALQELTERGLISVERPAGWELIVTLKDGTTEAGQ